VSAATAQGRLVWLALAMGIFVGAASIRCLDAALPVIAGEFGRSIGTAGAVVTAYALSYSALQLVAGPLGDRLGPYRVISWAALGSAVFAGGCALAATFEWLVVLRFLAGGAAAAIGPLTLLWVSHAAPDGERAVAIANLTAASILGTTAGQVGGGLLSGFVGWRAVFVVIAVAFAVAGAVLVRAAGRHAQLRNVGRREADDRAAPSPMQLLRRRAVWLVLSAVGVEGFALFMSFTYAAPLLQARHGVGSAGAGLLIALFGAGGVAFVMGARAIVSRSSDGIRAAVAGMLAAAGLAALALGGRLSLTAAALLMLGFGFFMLHNVIQLRATQMAPDAPGTGISLFAAMFFLSQAAGASIGGWLVDRAGTTLPFAASAVIIAGLGLVAGRAYSYQASTRWKAAK
jgi:predicted MFS family arabinose efflux permease